MGKLKPVVINGMLEEMVEGKPSYRMEAKHLAKSGRAALSVYKTHHTDKPDAEKMNFLDFMQIHQVN